MNRYPVVNRLLRKVTTVLDSLIDETIGDALQGNSTEAQLDNTFAVLTQAWRDEQRVEIRYKPLNKGESRHVIEPYWFEPAIWTDSVYVVAGLVMLDSSIKPVTLKLERIRTATIRPIKFERPDPKAVLQYLSQTWGIWVGDGEPVQVRLRFSNAARQRLLETRWHPTEQVTDAVDDAGSVLAIP
jgi:predicted DNA-binding transcriptional regulator YafY